MLVHAALRAPEIAHGEVADLAGLVGHAAGAGMRAAAVLRRGTVAACRRRCTCGDARQAGQGGRADLGDLAPDEEAVEQCVQLLALGQLVGRPNLRRAQDWSARLSERHPASSTQHAHNRTSITAQLQLELSSGVKHRAAPLLTAQFGRPLHMSLGMHMHNPVAAKGAPGKATGR